MNCVLSRNVEIENNETTKHYDDGDDDDDGGGGGTSPRRRRRRRRHVAGWLLCCSRLHQPIHEFEKTSRVATMWSSMGSMGSVDDELFLSKQQGARHICVASHMSDTSR